MFAKDFSFIIPVYNRPEEIEELLKSFTTLNCEKDFEVVIIEDGSSLPCKNIVKKFQDELKINYNLKENSGPGDSRNYGMKVANGTYFIVLDSDCILPENYLSNVIASLNENFVDFFGGPDAAHSSFTNLQKAIDFSMTSFLTTGGIRGKKSSVNKFQPRSFNMGISKEVFDATKGFGTIHPGEDPDFSIRAWKLGFESKLIDQAYVYHKRRISWSKFYRQVNKFGKARPILNVWYPDTRQLTYWFPSLFIIGIILAIFISLMGNQWLLSIYIAYFILLFIITLISKTNFIVALLVIPATMIQFYGYGVGFLTSTLKLSISKKEPKDVLPEMFFKV